MATETENYGYPKPDVDDFYDVGDFNQAMDMIDGDIKGIEESFNSAIDTKVDKVSGKGLSANDYTTAEKIKLAGIAANANNYSLPAASASARGGVKTGYAQTGKNYPVQLSNEQMYVNVPWTDTQKITGVKGNAESSYRTGNVNITAANIGLGNVNNTADANKNVASAKLLSVQERNWKQATDLPSTYPQGITVFMSTNPPGELFNGIPHCTVHTIKSYTNMACIQFVYPYNSYEDRFFFREAIYNTDAWRPWYEVITSKNIGSQSVNYATSAGKATNDGSGNSIVSTYAKKSIYGDTAISMGRESGTTVGYKSFAFGYDTEASGNYSHAEGSLTTASGNYSHAEGSHATAIEENSHAEGYWSTASGENSHAEGGRATASGKNSHAEGSGTASGENSHAEGLGATASGNYSHAEVSGTASGNYSHAEGLNTTASGNISHAEGLGATASNYASHASGKYNKTMTGGGAGSTQVGDVFVIGNGTSDTARSNALRVTYKGDIYGTKAFQSSGADYAEFIKPWADGNPDEEDRIGYFVTVKDGLLEKAKQGDYIAGITSGNPSIVGNADEDYYWRYERDEFNRIVMEDVPETIQKTDEDGKLVFDEETHEPVMVETGNIIKNARMKLAEGYDSSLQENYIERKDRKEWDYVGMLGVLPVRDDGTCLPDHFCKCSDDGIATLATEMGFYTYRVLERISENIVSVILR